MRHLFLLAGLISATLTISAQERSWDGIHRTPIDVAKQQFVNPPSTFANHVIWGLEGNVDKKRIQLDLDSIKSKGFRSVILEAGYRLPHKYLSEGWFKMISTIVSEAKKRDLKIWIIDEGKYPSGFAGGKFTNERPDLRMQALVTCDTLEVKSGLVLRNHPVDPDAISAVAISNSGAPDRVVPISADHTISFMANMDSWKIVFVKGDFRTGQTRAVDSPTGAKDTRNSQMDYLNPAATRQFLDWTHEQYKKYIGKEFGKTVMGFRGDEPDYSHTPFTPAIIDTFQIRKGYDVTPYLASFFSANPTAEERRVKADYWDVWSDMFSQFFFKQQADWCEANGLAHITHLNNEHDMNSCVRAEGDYFRDLSKVQIPGIDAIWNQIWPDTLNDFPKLASSVAHVYGKPRAFSESFAAYYTSPSIPEARYVVNQQMVRGINFFEYMFWLAGSDRPNWMTDPGMKGLNEYSNRLCYLLSQGQPGARIAMYYPTSSIWMGNNTTAGHIRNLSKQLLAHQQDFDYVPDDAFTKDGSVLKMGYGYLENKSGQRYNTIVIPSADVISEEAWKMISEFSNRGGKVLFWGNKPRYVVGKTFKDMNVAQDITNCYEEASDSWTSAVAAAMPSRPEIQIKSLMGPPEIVKPTRSGERAYAKPDPMLDLRYNHRILPDADIYFMHNEGHNTLHFKASLDAAGKVSVWNGDTGDVNEISFEVENGRTIVEVTLQPWETILLSIAPSKQELSITEAGAVGDGKTLCTNAIQGAIYKLAQQGGGVLVVPEGDFLTGALFFERGVDLHILKGGKLTSSTVDEDFPFVSTRFEGIEQEWTPALLNFTDCPGVHVWGEGTVDGKGVEWKSHDFAKHKGRPRMWCFTRCDGGLIEGLNMRDEASWCLHVLYTNGFTIDGVDIRAEHTIPSSDGIDIDSSSNIVIRNCYIEDNDDCITIKCGKDDDGRRVHRPSEDILIEDCRFGFGHSGVDFGSEVTGDIRRVTVRRCTMDPGNDGGIRFKSQPSRGGVLEDILFEDITVNDAHILFDIILTWRMVPPVLPPAEKLTEIRNVVIRRLNGTTEQAGRFTGYKEQPLTGFTFEDCHIVAKKALRKEFVDPSMTFEGLDIKVIE